MSSVRANQGGVMTDAGDTLRFVNTRDTGSLEIVKNLDGGTAEFGREFEFTVTLSRNDNIALAGTYLTQSGRTVAFEDNAAGGVTARVRVAGRRIAHDSGHSVRHELHGLRSGLHGGSLHDHEHRRCRRGGNGGGTRNLPQHALPIRVTAR